MRKVLISIWFILMMSVCFAIPGVETVFPISSGEYVFYRDYSFPTETYIGFLQYDNTTLAIRYYAKNPESGLEDITVYFSFNPNSDFIDMTGEKIIGNVTAEDTETLNYLHDLLYEFAGRRKKLNNSDFSNTLRINQDYVQFGGDVTMVYDVYIPIFNLNRILDEKGNSIFEAVTFGTLADSTDSSFSDFKGFSNLPDFSKKSKNRDLSSQWILASEDVKTLGEEAIWFSIYLDFGTSVENLLKSGIKATWFSSLAKTTLSSAGDLRVYTPSIAISENEEKCVLRYLTYSKEDNIYAYNFEIYTKEEGFVYKMDSISVLADFYYENKNYFDGLAK